MPLNHYRTEFCPVAEFPHNDKVNRFLLLLFISVALLGMMALMPEGQDQKNTAIKYDEAVERAPSSLPLIPASGEPSDNGLTQNLHREFKEILSRDRMAAIELGKEYIFTRELDPEFRLGILKELKAFQFTEPGVFDLAGEIIERKPDVGLVEEALHIKSAILSEEEFSDLLTDISGKTDSPELLSMIKKF